MVELVVQNYDKNKELFYKQEKLLKDCLGDNVKINHVGSTAIPDMVGKNIIDILVSADGQKHFFIFREKLIEIGFFPSEKSKTDIYQFFASTEKETTDGDVHVHLVVENTNRHDEFLILRDYLLKNPKEAKAYSQHKKELLSLGVKDRKLYRQEKSKYVSALIERAKNYFNK